MVDRATRRIGAPFRTTAKGPVKKKRRIRRRVEKRLSRGRGTK